MLPMRNMVVSYCKVGGGNSALNKRDPYLFPMRNMVMYFTAKLVGGNYALNKRDSHSTRELLFGVTQSLYEPIIMLEIQV